MIRHIALLLVLLALSAPVFAQGRESHEPSSSSEMRVDKLRDLIGEDYQLRRAVISPDGSTIAWQNASALCLYAIDTATTRCTEMPEDFGSVAPALVWSASSGKIAFTQDFFRFFNEPDLFTYDLKFDRFANLTDDGSHYSLLKVDATVPADVLPTWSPSGNLYWWRSYHADRPTQSVYRMNLNDTPEEIQNLTLLIPGPYSVYQQPAISADGSTMAFVALPGDQGNPTNGIYTVNLRNGGVQFIASLRALRAAKPSWIEDPKTMPIYIAWSGDNLVVMMTSYQLDVLEPSNALYVDVGTKKVTPLFDYNHYPSKPDFANARVDGPDEAAPILRTGIVSADGTRFLFLHYRSQDEIGLSSLPLPPDGSTPTLLATTSADIGAPDPVNSISADGTRLLMEGKLFSLGS